MAELDKVIKGFEQCWEKEPNTRNCDDCPYKKYRGEKRGKSCADRMHLDALELLKEQENEIDTLKTLVLGYETGAI